MKMKTNPKLFIVLAVAAIAAIIFPLRWLAQNAGTGYVGVAVGVWGSGKGSESCSNQTGQITMNPGSSGSWSCTTSTYPTGLSNNTAVVPTGEFADPDGYYNDRFYPNSSATVYVGSVDDGGGLWFGGYVWQDSRCTCAPGDQSGNYCGGAAGNTSGQAGTVYPGALFQFDVENMCASNGGYNRWGYGTAYAAIDNFTQCQNATSVAWDNANGYPPTPKDAIAFDPDPTIPGQCDPEVPPPPPTGTINVTSENSVTGAPVSSSWWFEVSTSTSSVAQTCSATSTCTGASATYDNQPAATGSGVSYILNPVAGSAGSGYSSYEFGGNGQSQNLTGGATNNFTILWIPAAAPISLPTATLTADSSHSIKVNVGDTIDYAWSSTSGATATSSYTVNGGASQPWVVGTLSGSTSGVVVSSQAGNTYVITYTVTNNKGSVSDSDTIVVAPPAHLECVNNACTSVSGAGPNRCTSNNDCTGPTYAACDPAQQACVNESGTASSSCTSDPACGGNNNSHFACENDSCLIVGGAGANQCTTPGLTCTSTTHLECVNNACTSVSGAGPNRCTSNNDCTGPTYAACDPAQQACVNESGTASSSCTSDPACGGNNNSHFACENDSCLIVGGAGANQCTTPGLTCTSTTHLECVNNACTSVSGAGPNRCTSNNDCTGPTYAACDPAQQA